MIVRIEANMLNKIASLYAVHFGNKDPERVTCKDCLDFKIGLCAGGGGFRNIFACMYDKAEKCEIFEG